MSDPGAGANLTLPTDVPATPTRALGERDLRVLRAVAALPVGEDGWRRPRARAQLEDDTGLSYGTLRRALGDLEKRTLVEQDVPPCVLGKPCGYRLTQAAMACLRPASRASPDAGLMRVDAGSKEFLMRVDAAPDPEGVSSLNSSLSKSKRGEDTPSGAASDSRADAGLMRVDPHHDAGSVMRVIASQAGAIVELTATVSRLTALVERLVAGGSSAEAAPRVTVESPGEPLGAQPPLVAGQPVDGGPSDPANVLWNRIRDTLAEEGAPLRGAPTPAHQRVYELFRRPGAAPESRVVLEALRRDARSWKERAAQERATGSVDPWKFTPALSRWIEERWWERQPEPEPPEVVAPAASADSGLPDEPRFGWTSSKKEPPDPTYEKDKNGWSGRDVMGRRCSHGQFLLPRRNTQENTWFASSSHGCGETYDPRAERREQAAAAEAAAARTKTARTTGSMGHVSDGLGELLSKKIGNTNRGT